MIIITYTSGQERLIQGQTLKKLDQESARLGQIGFVTNKDGYPFGECHGIAFKSNIADVIEVSDEVFQAKVDEQKKKHEEQKKQRKTEADYIAAVREKDAYKDRCEKAEALRDILLKELESRKLRGRIRRLFGRA